MRRILLAALTLAMASGAAIACDDHVGQCEIEEWKPAYLASVEAVRIDGVTTCDQGKVRLRLYDGEGDARKFIAVDTAYIEGHIFQTFVRPVEKPSALSIKYSIDPG